MTYAKSRKAELWKLLKIERSMRKRAEAELDRTIEKLKFELQKQQLERKEKQYRQWFRVRLSELRQRIVPAIVERRQRFLEFDEKTRTFRYFDASIQILYPGMSTILLRVTKELTYNAVIVREVEWKADYSRSKASNVVIWSMVKSWNPQFDTSDSHVSEYELIDDLILCIRYTVFAD